MKTLFHLATGLIILLVSGLAHATENWETDFEEAKKAAAVEGKDLLVDFTGSDWCIPCRKLEKEVFQNPDFSGGEDFVLVSIDMPQDKSKQSEELREQNNRLVSSYSVSGFPTIFLMDSGGNPYARVTGFQAGGVEAFNANLKALLKQKVARDAAFKALESAETDEGKADALVACFEAMPNVPARLYPEQLGQLKALRPGAELAFIKKTKAEKDRSARIEKLTKQVANGELEGEELQKAQWFLHRRKRFETLAEEIVALEKIAAIKPGTRQDRTIRSVVHGLNYYSAAKNDPLKDWLTNLNQAMEAGKRANKDLVVAFLSSREDYSAAFKSDVLGKLDFDGIDEFVLTCLEFPTMLSNSDDFSEHDAMLKSARDDYAMTRFPVVLVMDAEGKPYGRFLEFGLQQRSTALSLGNRISELKEQRSKRDQAFAAADAANSDDEKAAKIVEAFEAMPGVQPFFYPARVAELKRIQPKAWLFEDRSVEKTVTSKADREIIIQRQLRRIEVEDLQGEKLQVARGLINFMKRFKTVEEELAAWEPVVAIDPSTKHGKLYSKRVEELRKKLEDAQN